MYLEFPIPIMPSFVKLDVSELPALAGGLRLRAGVRHRRVCLIKNLIKLPSTSTAAVGELFNFVMGALFVGVAGFVYKRRRRPAEALSSAQGWARWSWPSSVRAVQLLHRLPGLCGLVPPAAGGHHRDVPGHQSQRGRPAGLPADLQLCRSPLFKGLLDAALCFLI